jgi:hypothetical protein
LGSGKNLEKKVKLCGRKCVIAHIKYGFLFLRISDKETSDFGGLRPHQ